MQTTYVHVRIPIHTVYTYIQEVLYFICMYTYTCSSWTCNTYIGEWCVHTCVLLLRIKHLFISYPRWFLLKSHRGHWLSWQRGRRHWTLPCEKQTTNNSQQTAVEQITVEHSKYPFCWTPSTIAVEMLNDINWDATIIQ